MDLAIHDPTGGSSIGLLFISCLLTGNSGNSYLLRRCCLPLVVCLGYCVGVRVFTPRELTDRAEEAKQLHIIPDRVLTLLLLLLQKCLRFSPDASVWKAKQQVLCSLTESLRDVLNYGLFQPATDGHDAKFLEEERLLKEYPQSFEKGVPYLEVKGRSRRTHWGQSTCLKVMDKEKIAAFEKLFR